MTLAEALALPAGPELDRIVAERVMGWTEVERRMDFYHISPNALVDVFRSDEPWTGKHPRQTFCGDKYHEEILDYSTDARLALKVLGRLVKFSISGGYGGRAWDVDAESESGSGWGEADDSLPLAICRAALAACWGEEPAR